jgi:hypothetical protein
MSPSSAAPSPVHAGLPLSGGFVGVDVFCVISGYVIGGMLFRQLEGGARFSFVSFYTRATHLSVDGALTLVDRFRGLIRRHARYGTASATSSAGTPRAPMATTMYCRSSTM